MSSRITLTIKDFQIRGGNITMKITSAIIGEKMVGAVRVPKLIITRKPDFYTSRFAMLALLRRTQPNRQDLNFPQLTLTSDKCDTDGKMLSTTLIDFFDAVVENIKPNGDEEEITFLADRKSGDFTISNIVVRES